MKTIIIYQSKTGFTKRYAQWIAEATGGEAVSLKDAKKVNFPAYDALVCGGWSFAGHINGLKKMQPILAAFPGKKVLFATGATPPEAQEAKDFLANCLTGEEKKSIRSFYMQGGLDYARMNVVHKTMMKMMSNMMKKQYGEDSEQYRGVSRSFDATDRKYIEPIVAYLVEPNA